MVLAAEFEPQRHRAHREYSNSDLCVLGASMVGCLSGVITFYNFNKINIDSGVGCWEILGVGGWRLNWGLVRCVGLVMEMGGEFHFDLEA